MRDTWNPEQYDKFAAERRQPFVDLLHLVEPVPGGLVVDLGCGTGSLTAELHQATGAVTTVGIDSSAAMLAKAEAVAGGGLRFVLGDIAAGVTVKEAGKAADVVFANASLQWVPDHRALLPRLVKGLAPGGQLAFQVPANQDHPSHLLAREMADEPEWREAFVGRPPENRATHILLPEEYATALDGLGAEELHVRLQVYGHHLASAEAVVEWVRGTLLTPYQAALEPDVYERFVGEYRQRLVQNLGPSQPYFYAFKRILVRARFAG